LLQLELAKAPARLRSAEALTFLTVSCAAVRFGQRGRRLQRAGNANNDGQRQQRRHLWIAGRRNWRPKP